MTHAVWFRPAVTAAALFLIGIGACTTPTQYDVEMGKQVDISFAGAGKSLPDLQGELAQIQDYVQDLPDVEGVSFNVRARPDTPVQAGITVWGQHLDGDVLVAGLKSRFALLEQAEIALTPLEGTTRGSVADRLGHDLFKIKVKGQTAEEVRQQILDELARRHPGAEPDVQVIDRSDGRREVRIEMKETRPEP